MGTPKPEQGALPAESEDVLDRVPLRALVGPTASGKSVCYTAPVLQALLESGGRARALFLYPTKALSQDQTAGLTALVEARIVEIAAEPPTPPGTQGVSTTS
jgi:hypothetical protein